MNLHRFRSLLWASAFLPALALPSCAQNNDLDKPIAGMETKPKTRLAQAPVEAPPATNQDLRDLYSDT